MSDPETKPIVNHTDQPARRRPRWRRWLINTLKGLALLTILLLLLHTVLNLRAEAQLKRTLERLQAEGLPMEVAQLVPAPVPRQQNGAGPLRAAIAVRDDEPTFALAKAIEDWYDPTGKRPDVGPDPAQAVAMREKLRDPSLTLIYDKLYRAAACPAANFDYDYDQGPGLLLPQLSKLRSFARLLGARAWLRAEQGDDAGALADLRVTVRLARLLEPEPIFICQLLRTGMARIATQELRRLLARPRTAALPADAVAALVKELQAARTANRAAMVRALDGERVVFGGWMFDRLLGRKPMASAVLRDFLGSPVEKEFLDDPMLYPLWGGVFYLLRPWVKSDYRYYLELMGDWRRECAKPYWKTDPAALGTGRVQALPNLRSLSGMLFPALEKLPAHAAQGEADLLLAEVALALDQYRHAQGHYPADLKELGLAVNPVDPFTGKPLIYRQTAAGGALLYSVGANGTDDGGQVGPQPGQPLDLVWEVRP